jgi:dihydropteroate synthase
MNCKGKILDLDLPVVMGILNATPDSFYNKGRESSLAQLLEKGISMIGEGATILDIGGQSSRPGAQQISAAQEAARILPLIQEFNRMFPSTILSVDTFYSEVAHQALVAGADMVNDISGGMHDTKMIKVIVEQQAAFVCMHMKGMPQTMQLNPVYENVLEEVFDFFEQRINYCRKQGLKDVILDVGFGFGKTLEHNYKLLQHLDMFHRLHCPLMAGISRKSMVYKPLNANADQALNGSSALHMIALERGAKILRVHDVKEAKEVVTLHKLLHES